jgi:hypothetical protein
MLALQKYLSSVGEEANRTVGSTLALELDGSRYEPRMRRFFIAEPKPADPQGSSQPGDPNKTAGLEDLGEQLGSSTATDVQLTFAEARKPGIYYFDLYPRPEPGMEEPRPERRAYAFNVDTETESNLKRAGKESLEYNPTDTAVARGKVTLDNVESITSRKLARQSDWSEKPWIYLIILLVLVLEQAMAVHLSFHLKGNEAQLPPQAAQSRAAA